MFGDYFHNLEVLNSYALVAHLAGHTHAFEHLCGIRAGTYRTGGTQTVVLAVGGLAYTAETMAFYNTLETFTLAGTDYVNEVCFGEEVDSDGVAQFVFTVKTFELGQVTLGSYTGFLEVTEFGFGAMLFLLLAEAKLEGIVTVGLNGLNLSNYTRTYFDNSARHILAVGTEYGCHSDFFSN